MKRIAEAAVLTSFSGTAHLQLFHVTKTTWLLVRERPVVGVGLTR